MLTPLYGSNKQIQYRNEVFNRIKESYTSYKFNVLSLGGANCFSNKDSLERQLIDKLRLRQITIVESDKKSCKKILSSINVFSVRYNAAHCIIYKGMYKHCVVTIVQGSLYSYLKYCSSNSIQYKVIVADYYCTLNYKNERDLKLLNNVYDTNALLFWTTAIPIREKNTNAARRIYKYDSNGRDNYITGCKKFIRSRVKSNVIELKSWTYDNKDIGGHYTMGVIQLKVS